MRLGDAVLVVSLVSFGCGTKNAKPDPPTCVPKNGVYSCLGGTWPVCPSGVGPEFVCASDITGCMGCSSDGYGFTCSCMDAGGLGGFGQSPDGSVDDSGSIPHWFCVATYYPCQ